MTVDSRILLINLDVKRVVQTLLGFKKVVTVSDGKRRLEMDSDD